MSLEGLTVVYDGANGAASAVGPEVFEKLGAKVIAINVDPDGVNINETPVPLIWKASRPLL